MSRVIGSPEPSCAVGAASRRALVAVGGVFIAACFPVIPQADDPSLHVHARDFEWIVPQGQALAEDVAAMRGLAVTSNISFETLDDVSFEALVGLDSSPDGIDDADPLVRAFGLGTPKWERRPALRRSYAKGVLGLYKTGSNLVQVRARSKTDESAWVLVHEIEHALQDQRGSVPWAHQTHVPDDQRLARLALLEGDAEISAAVYVAGGRHLPGGWLSHVLVALRDDRERAAAFRDVPSFYGSQWVFPYTAGTTFVGQIYRAGGFPLVQKALAHPPVSTEQVLHPDKYVRGELPMSLEVPAFPDGWRRAASGTMGELRIRALLDACPHSSIGAVPLGWGGDTYSIAADPGGRVAMLWSTAWDDVPSAERFEQAIRAHETCRGRSDDDDTAIRREGDRVAYVRGLTSGANEATAWGLLEAHIDRPEPDPPLGDVRLPPLVDTDTFLRQGRIRQGWYVSEPLGLTTAVAGYDAIQTSAELSLERYAGITRINMDLNVVLGPWTDDFERRLSWELVDAIREGGYPVSYDGERSVASGAGPARVLSWSTGLGQARVIVMPTCGERMTILVIVHDGGPGAWEAEARWLARVQVRDDSAACKYLQASER